MKLVWVLTIFSTLVLMISALPNPELRKKNDEPKPLMSLKFKVPEKLVRNGELGNANDYMDEVMALVRDEIVNAGLDRIELPNGDFSFEWNFVTGGVFLHNGLAYGMETIHRVGDATLSSDGTIIYFESDCGINNGAFGYAITIEFMDIGPSASLTGVATYVNFYFKARIDVLSALAVVEIFDIKQVGPINTDITGLGIFNWLAEQIADFAINLIKPFFKELIEGPITNIINKVLQAYVDSLLKPATTALPLIVKNLA